MQNISMIAIKNNTCWIRPDQIEHIEPVYYDGANLIELEVYLLSGGHHTLNDPEDIQKVIRSIIFLLPDGELCGEDISF